MKKGGFCAGASVHDPAIFLDKDGTYYIFGTHMTAAESKDLRHWKCFAKWVTTENPLFEGLFQDVGTSKKNAFSFTEKFNGRGYAVWAPDVTYNPYLKKYVMYFCTTGSYVKSAICMAVADEVKGPYRYVDTLLCSGFDAGTVDKTNVAEILGTEEGYKKYLKKNGKYNNLAWPNCIDPNLYHDREGRLWMVYGSWSGGIFVLEMDEKTGYPIRPAENPQKHVDSYFGKKILGGGHKSIEGPYVLYDEVSDYFYLFVSYGWLGRDGGYQIRMFRSKSPEGPYVDMKGKNILRVPHHAPYGVKLMGNYTFPSLKTGYKAPGHNSAFCDKDGKLYLVHHQRFDSEQEFHEPRVHRLFRTAEGWLTVCPFATERESVWKGEVPDGTYYVVEHGLDISGEMHLPVEAEVKVGENLKVCEDGSVTFLFNGITYEGVACKMTDEAENPVLCITALGENRSVWCVKYLDETGKQGHGCSVSEE